MTETKDATTSESKKTTRKEDLSSLAPEKLVEKCLALTTDNETFRTQLRKSKKAEYAAKFKLTMKEKECTDLQNERRLARWGAVSEGNERKEPLMDVYVHDTITFLNAQLRLKKQQIDELTSDVKVLKAKKTSEFGREMSEKLRQAAHDNSVQKEQLKKMAYMEKQIALLQKANNTLKNQKRDAECELSSRDRRITTLEERISCIEEGREAVSQADENESEEVRSEQMDAEEGEPEYLDEADDTAEADGENNEEMKQEGGESVGKGEGAEKETTA